jgi:hypothetical protein
VAFDVGKTKKVHTMSDYNAQTVRELRWIRCILLAIAAILIVLVFAVDQEVGKIVLVVAGGATMLGIILKAIDIVFSRTDLHTKQSASIEETDSN